MRTIDADTLLETMEEYRSHQEKCQILSGGRGYSVTWNDAVRFIENAPTIESEQVHCKDCLMHGVCRFEQGLGLDGYCSQAERREDG